MRHTIGPFPKPPVLSFVVHSLGVWPKKTGGARLIMDLSRPFGNSVNDFISREVYTMSCCNVDDAIRILSRVEVGVSMAKLDLRHAFRIIPVHPSDWNLLGYSHNDQFYFDIVLPFGLRSSTTLFNQLSNCLEWILRYHGQFDGIFHDIDDFFFVGPCNCSICKTVVDLITKYCDFLSVPLALEKTEGLATAITFLGILLDRVHHKSPGGENGGNSE